MIREERVKREKRVQIPGASAYAKAYNTGVSGNCLVLSALMRFLFLVFIKSFSLFKRYCPLWVPAVGSFTMPIESTGTAGYLSPRQGSHKGPIPFRLRRGGPDMAYYGQKNSVMPDERSL